MPEYKVAQWPPAPVKAERTNNKLPSWITRFVAHINCKDA